jgi:Mg2+-importing ATPase
VCLFGLWLPYSPLATAIGLTPLPGAYGLAVAAILFGYVVTTQWVKSWVVHRFGVS